MKKWKQEIEKCKNDPIYFLKNYFVITDHKGNTHKLNPFQLERAKELYRLHKRQLSNPALLFVPKKTRR